MVHYDFLDKDKYIIDIKNCDKSKTYITAYVHLPNQSEYSFWVTTAPHTICYFGDIGYFIFRGNISAIQALNFFGSFDKPNYGYFHEKLDTRNALVFSSESIQRSLMEFILERFDIPEDKFTEKDLENLDFEYLLDIIEKLPDDAFGGYSFPSNYEDSIASYVSQELLELLNLSYDELDFGSFMYRLTQLFEEVEPYECWQSINNKDYTSQYKLCCDNLCYFSNKILEAADEFLKKEPTNI